MWKRPVIYVQATTNLRRNIPVIFQQLKETQTIHNMSVQVKFSSNASGKSATASFDPNGPSVSVQSKVSLEGGKVDQVEVLSGGNGVKIQIGDKSATAPGFGNNIINFSPAADINSLYINVSKS